MQMTLSYHACIDCTSASDKAKPEAGPQPPLLDDICQLEPFRGLALTYPGKFR